MGVHRAGFVAIVGRPNAGKSTLLNALLGEKVAIVTPKPQTTRDRIMGVLTRPGAQLAFVDTPGFHQGKKALNKHLVHVALSVLGDVDVVLMLVDVTRTGPEPGAEDAALLDAVRAATRPTVLVFNKVDQVDKATLYPLVQAWSALAPWRAVVPVSALHHDGLDRVLNELSACLPESPPLFDDDTLTDRPIRFLVAELLREQLMLALGEELPYSVAVEIMRYAERPDGNIVDIAATIHVERDSQKPIVLGKGGETIKAVGAAARLEMEKLIGRKVFLETHVRVEPNWTRSAKGLRKLGYQVQRPGGRR